MELAFKVQNYKVKKVKNYVKKNKLFFFFNGINKNYNNWLETQQNFKKIDLNCFKTFNKALSVGVKTSIYCNINSSISSVIFLVKSNKAKKNLLKKVIFNKLETLLFLMMLVKLNNKIYSKNQLKQINNLNYTDNSLVLFRFFNGNLKIRIKKFAKSK